MDIALVPVRDIRPPFEILRTVNKGATEYLELKDSMAEKGLMHSIQVRLVGDKYEVVTGNHRFHVAQDLGWDTIACTIVECSDEEVLIRQIEENACRKDTTPMEYALQFQKYIDHRAAAGIKTNFVDIARIVNKKSTWVKRILSLLKLSSEVQKMVDSGEFTLTAAYALSSIPVCYHEQFIGPAKKLSTRDFELMVAEFAREIRGRADERGRERAAIRDEELHPQLRNLKIIEKELDTPENCARLILDAGAQTALEGAKIALAWVLQQDAESQITRSRKADKRRFWNRWSKEYREKLQDGDIGEILSIEEFFDDFLKENK